MSSPSSRCRFGQQIGPDEGWPLGARAEKILWRHTKVVLTILGIDLREEFPEFTRHTEHSVAVLAEHIYDAHLVERCVFVDAFASEARGVSLDIVYQLLELGLNGIIQWARTAQLAGLEADVVAGIHDSGDGISTRESESSDAEYEFIG